MRPAITAPARLCRFRALRRFFAIADHFQALYRQAKLPENFERPPRALVAQPDVVLRRATLVAMPFDDHLDLRESGEHREQQVCVLAQRRQGVRPHVRAIVIEERVVQLAIQLMDDSGDVGRHRDTRVDDRLFTRRRCFDGSRGPLDGPRGCGCFPLSTMRIRQIRGRHRLPRRRMTRAQSRDCNDHAHWFHDSIEHQQARQIDTLLRVFFR